MRGVWTGRGVFGVIVGLTVIGSPVAAQVRPWDTFEDLLSNSVCDVVNTANAEMVVLHETGQFVIVSGADVTLEDSFVDVDGFVFMTGFVDSVGFIDFAEDGDGFRTLWWTTLAGHVVEVDEFTGEPSATALFPTDFSGVPCDACPLWDDPNVCALPPVSDEPPISFNICGSNIPISLGVTLGALMFMRLARTRARRSRCA